MKLNKTFFYFIILLPILFVFVACDKNINDKSFADNKKDLFTSKEDNAIKEQFVLEERNSKEDNLSVNNTNSVKTSSNDDNAIISMNLVKNGNFIDDLKCWSCDKNINIAIIDDIKCVEVIGTSNKQTRLCQPVNTVSGHVYRLTFDLKTEDQGAFAILRDEESKSEYYLFTRPSIGWRKYSKHFQSYKNGKYLLFLSSNKEGHFYFSNISFVDTSDMK